MISSYKNTYHDYLCSTDKSLLQIDMIHNYLHNDSYWAKGRSREKITNTIEHSICFGIYTGTEQVGFARVVSDQTIFAYIMDVFILDAHRGKGLGKFLMRCMMEHPDLQGLRRWMLATRDAHGLYRQFGFQAPAEPDIHMEKLDKNV